MPSSIVRQPATSEDDVRSEQMRRFDRWHVAADIIRRLREAGISCEMDDDLNPPLKLPVRPRTQCGISTCTHHVCGKTLKLSR